MSKRHVIYVALRGKTASLHHTHCNIYWSEKQDQFYFKHFNTNGARRNISVCLSKFLYPFQQTSFMHLLTRAAQLFRSWQMAFTVTEGLKDGGVNPVNTFSSEYALTSWTSMQRAKKDHSLEWQ